jgi:hypothetical protein
MINLLPTAVDILAESGTVITSSVSKNVPIIGNIGLYIDSLHTTGQAGINFCCSSNSITKVFFGASCACGIMGATESGAALATSFAGIPLAGWIGSFGAKGLNNLGKYRLHMGNVTNGNVTNVTHIAELMG